MSKNRLFKYKAGTSITFNFRRIIGAKDIFRSKPTLSYNCFAIFPIKSLAIEFSIQICETQSQQNSILKEIAMKSSGLLEEAKAINASLHRVKKNLHFSLSQSEQAANQLAFDGNLISETLDSHQHEIKHSLASTKIRLDRIKR